MENNETVFLACFQAINTIIIALLGAYFYRNTERIKTDINQLNSKAILKFSKLHEIRLDILKLLSKDLYKVEFEFNAEYQKQQCQDLCDAVEILTNNFHPNAIFLDKHLRDTIYEFIDNLNNHIEDRQKHYDYTRYSVKTEEDEAYEQFESNVYEMAISIFYNLKNEINNAVEKILNEDVPQTKSFK